MSDHDRLERAALHRGSGCGGGPGDPDLWPVKAEPLAAKTRPALTGPARGGCQIWRSGKNARGTGRTKEWTWTRMKKPGSDLRHCVCICFGADMRMHPR